MNWVVGGALALMIVACGNRSLSADAAPAPPPVLTETKPATAKPLQPLAPAEGLKCAGAAAQGGVMICRTWPGAAFSVDGVPRGVADSNGWFVVGFDRDASPTAEIKVRIGATEREENVAVSPRSFSVQRVDGLPPQTVTPTEPAVLAKIEKDKALKNRAFASRGVLEGYLEGFVWPVSGRMSGPWGAQRILNGDPRSPHYGIDIAAPTGSTIRAPAGGAVVLAEPDMHFEGGLVLLDHGQGLISMYLHMSRVDVREGDQVVQGDTLGAVGQTGRTTGPHLCWRMKWRDRNVDPSLAVAALNIAREELGYGARIDPGAAPAGFTAWSPNAP